MQEQACTSSLNSKDGLKWRKCYLKMRVCVCWGWGLGVTCPKPGYQAGEAELGLRVQDTRTPNPRKWNKW